MALTKTTVDRRAFSLTEVAKIYGISLGMVRKQIREGKLGIVRIGRRVLVTNESLQQWLSSEVQ